MIFPKNSNVILAALLAVALTTVFILSLTVFGELKEQRSQTASLFMALNQRVGVASEAATDFLKDTSKNMLFLQSLLSEEKSGATWSEAGAQKFMEHNEAYEELYIFNEDGKCVLKAVSGKHVAPRSCGTIADVILRSVKAARGLLAGELFSSPLLRYGNTLSLVYSMALKDGKIAVAAVSAESFLEEVRRLAREDEMVFLVDSEGGYLAHPNQLKERLLGASDNFYTDFPEAEMGVLDNEDVSSFYTERELFSFWRIRPSESDFALYKGTQNARVEALNKEQWILVAVSEK